MLTSIPATVGDSPDDAAFHSHVATQETRTPSTSATATNPSALVAPGAVSNWSVRRARGIATTVTTPVATPTTVAHCPAGTSGCSAMNRAFAIPYQVHSATAPTQASSPSTLVVVDVGSVACAPLI